MKKHEVIVQGHLRIYAKEKKTCPQCQKEFWGTKKAKFCGRLCRDLDYYARKGEEVRARQREAYQQKKNTL